MAIDHKEDLFKARLSVCLVGVGRVGLELLKRIDSRGVKVPLIVTKSHRDLGNRLEAFGGSIWITDVSRAIDNPTIDVLIEAIDDTDAARNMIIAALKQGKDVVSCSKDVWVKHRDELSQIARVYGRRLCLNSLVAASKDFATLDYDLNEDTIASVDINEIGKFRGADGAITAESMSIELNALVKAKQEKILEQETKKVSAKQLSFESGRLNGYKKARSFYEKNPIFFINGDCHSLYHGIVDEVGQALYLKKILPNLRTVLLWTNPQPSWLMVSLAQLFNFDVMPRRVGTYSHIDAERMQIVKTSTSTWIKRKLAEQGMQIETDIHDTVWRKMSVPILKEAFLPLCTKDDSLNKKIFLKMEPRKLVDSGREFSKKDVILLTKFFTQKGYVVIDPMEHSLHDQINIIHNATHIVSMAGSNSAHSIYAKQEAVFVMLNLSETYGFGHDELIEQACNHGYYFTGTVLELIKDLRAMESIL